jgi:hypothetical protein
MPCYLVASRASPVVLWDPMEGCIRASYRSYNAMDEHVSPFSLLWSSCAASPSMFYAGFGGFEDTVAHVRAFDAVLEGRDALWSYRSQYVKDKTTIVTSLSPALHSVNPNLLAIGYSSGALVEVLDGRHRRAATIFDPSSGNPSTSKPLQSNGIACMRTSRRSPWYIYVAPRVSNGQPILTWDLRRSSTPVANVNFEPLSPGRKPCGVFDIVPVGENAEGVICAGGPRGLQFATVTDTGAATVDVVNHCTDDESVDALKNASVVSVVGSLRDGVVRCVVGGGGCSVVDNPVRDRWEENAGKGTSIGGLRRGRDGQLLTPMDDDQDDASSAPITQDHWLACVTVRVS